MIFLDQLNSILATAGVSRDLQIPWREAYRHLKPKQLLLLLEILKHSLPEEIHGFSSLLKRKIAVLKDKNAVYWSEIIREEKRELAKL